MSTAPYRRPWLVRKVDPVPSGAWHEVAANVGPSLLAKCGRTFLTTKSHSASAVDGDDLCAVCAGAPPA